MCVSVTDLGRGVSYSADVRTCQSPLKRVRFMLIVARAMLSVANARQAHGLVMQYTCSGRLAPGGVVRSIFRFMFVVVPTAALATAVVVGVSNSKTKQAVAADGDLQRDLQLASTASIELAPAGRPVTTISAIEAPPSATPERSVRPKRSRNGSRVVRSRAPTVTAAAAPEVAESTDDAESAVTTDLAAAAAEANAEAPADGGVALPRPTAIPVAYPTGGGDAGTYDPGPGSVIRGGGIDPDHCQIHGGRGRAGPPIFRQPRGPSLGERIRGAARASGGSSERPSVSLGERIRQGSRSSSRSSGSSARSGGSSSGSRSLGERIRSARGR
jgi:hypothetical protein